MTDVVAVELELELEEVGRVGVDISVRVVHMATFVFLPSLVWVCFWLWCFGLSTDPFVPLRRWHTSTSEGLHLNRLTPTFSVRETATLLLYLRPGGASPPNPTTPHGSNLYTNTGIWRPSVTGWKPA